MALTSHISAYSEAWPTLYQQAAAELTPVFGAELIAMHHVGSTAVPNLSAKPGIDILAVIRDGDVGRYSAALTERGYRRGGDLSPQHAFFKRDVNGVRTHKLHVCVDGHTKITEMLNFRDHLRQNPEACRAYEKLKLRLEGENTRGIGEYLDGKAPFIKAITDNF